MDFDEGQNIEGDHIIVHQRRRGGSSSESESESESAPDSSALDSSASVPSIDSSSCLSAGLAVAGTAVRANSPRAASKDVRTGSDPPEGASQPLADVRDAVDPWRLREPDRLGSLLVVSALKREDQQRRVIKERSTYLVDGKANSEGCSSASFSVPGVPGP